MASRKTYFGIGFRDPNDPESGPAGKSDSDDRSQPTIVDDEKVAEGLRQLRSWYQSDEQPAESAPATGAPVATPASSIGGSQARPTAVGHATGPPPSSAQRPIAPDPMRATMYGHDVHQFDLDAPAAGGEVTPAASSTALVLANPGSGQHAVTRQAGAVPTAAAWPQSDSFNLAPYGGGEAERLPRPVGIRQSSRDIRPRTRMPISARVMFGVGLAAFGAAVAIWLLSGNEPETSAIQPAAAPTSTSPARPVAPAVAPGASAVVPAMAAPPAERGSVPEAPARPPTSLPARVPIPTVAAPKTERARAPATPATLRTPRRPREAKVEEAKPAAGNNEAAAAATTPPAAAKETPPPAKPRTDTDETLPPSEE